MRWFIRPALLLGFLVGLAGVAQAWSCSSDEPLAATATAEDRARVALEVAQARAIAEAMACLDEGRSDCPDMPALLPVSSQAAETSGQ